jgi:antitoxin component of MazEF toxin-antitoxin module
MTVTVKKIGGSVGVVIPKTLANDLALVEGMPLELLTQGDSIVMRKGGRRPRRKLSKIVSQIKPASYHRRRAELRDQSIGKELW